MENETKATKKMTIARALKEKERVARKLKSARETLGRVNSVMVGLKRPVDAKEAFEAVQRLQNRFLEIKKAIAAANAGISAQLTEMLVVRAEKEYYEKLDCRESSPRGEWEGDRRGARAASVRPAGRGGRLQRHPLARGRGVVSSGRPKAGMHGHEEFGWSREPPIC